MFLSMDTVPLKSKDNCLLTDEKVTSLKVQFSVNKKKILVVQTQFVKEFNASMSQRGVEVSLCAVGARKITVLAAEISFG